MFNVLLLVFAILSVASANPCDPSYTKSIQNSLGSSYQVEKALANAEKSVYDALKLNSSQNVTKILLSQGYGWATSLGFIHPLFAVALNVFSAFFSQLFGDPNAFYKQLVEQILKAVDEMIDQKLLKQNLTAASDDLGQICRDMQRSSGFGGFSNTQLSSKEGLYFNGQCFTNPTGSTCKKWEEAGSVIYAYQYARMALAFDLEKGLIADYEYDRKTYGPMLKRSLNTFRDGRMKKIVTPKWQRQGRGFIINPPPTDRGTIYCNPNHEKIWATNYDRGILIIFNRTSERFQFDCPFGVTACDRTYNDIKAATTTCVNKYKTTARNSFNELQRVIDLF